MRVVLSTISRFHMFDVARQLVRYDLLERLFTGQPRWKTRSDGIPSERVSCLPVLEAPYEVAARFGLAERHMGRRLERLTHLAHDGWVAGRMPECDVFAGLVYGSRRSGMKARRRGAVWVCDAPTPHTEELERVVEEESTAWGVPYASKPWRMIEEEVATYGAADHITVASRYAKQTYVERGIPPNRITVIPYGIDVGHFAPRPRREQCGFQVLFAGTMSPLKGVQYLAAAMRLAAIPDSKLVLVGAVLPETQRLLDGAPNVEIRGHVERSVLPDYFSDADVMVLPSLSDGFGLVIGQALACGCPVIATETTGGSDMLTDGVNGFVVPARSAEAIAEKLTWLYEHPLERQEMRARALESVRHLGGWDTYGDALVALFTRLRRERL